MSISTQIKIEIAGESLTRFSKLVINQKVQTHHRFSLLQPLPKEFVSQAVEKAQAYVGKSIKISINPSNMLTDSPLVFNGIITEAQMVRTSGASGGIVINGYSPTILLEGAPTVKSYTNQNLKSIVDEVLKEYASEELNPQISIEKDALLPYTVQYGESDFGFLSRIAQKKGQWFYYNGEALFFGKPKSKKFTLEYGRSLHSFNIEMRAKSVGFEYLGYDPSNAETQKANSEEVNFQPDGYSKTIFETSKKLFPKNSTILYPHALEEGNSRTHLIDRVTTQLQSRSADMVTAKGDSDETGLRIGDVVSIKEPSFSLTGNVLDGLQEQNFGNYIITDIMHVCDESGTYHNSFDAVPENVLSPPYGNVHSFPTAETQPATVISNADPAGLGRVQVAFAWQKEAGKTTPWIRMINAHSGGGKGFYFIPEVGEEVLVAFEGGNAEKPFVLGAMYNGGASSGYSSSGNDKKVIQTRSGTKVIMDDAAGSVFIEDPSGNTYLMDGQGNIKLNAPNNMTIVVGKNLDIQVGENMSTTIGANEDISIGSNKTETIGKNYIQTSENKNVTVKNDKTDHVGENYRQIAGNSDIQTSKGDLKLRGTTLTVIQGGKDVKVSKG